MCGLDYGRWIKRERDEYAEQVGRVRGKRWTMRMNNTAAVLERAGIAEFAQGPSDEALACVASKDLRGAWRSLGDSPRFAPTIVSGDEDDDDDFDDDDDDAFDDDEEFGEGGEGDTEDDDFLDDEEEEEGDLDDDLDSDDEDDDDDDDL
jgi:hypothetical protein